MSDHFEFSPWKSLHGQSGHWYEAVELLGLGRNAAVFLVHGTTPELLGQFFAVKVFRRLSRADSREKFLEEISLLETLTHPNTLRVYDRGTYYDNPFLVAEYLPETLRQRMNRGLSLVEKLSIALQLSAAVKYVNSMTPQVVHRDIKPENIFIKGRSAVLV
ncbi:MAG TPA: protein kinase [Pirellulaceae bacterium]|jgi:serine/threonine-protein kinase ULK/ATG1|nr:protein kinase [Pirellulaceae bacterium]